MDRKYFQTKVIQELMKRIPLMDDGNSITITRNGDKFKIDEN